MCGVIGFYSDQPNGQHREALLRLFTESKIRGLHAFGLSADFGDGEIVTRRFFSLPLLCRFLESMPPPRWLMGHNRYCTSGDWQERGNNQPLEVDGAILVFNGVIDMRSRAEWESSYPFPFITENDGEVFIRRMQAGEAPGRIVEVGCTFAGLYFHQGEVWALRNAYRPLWFWPGARAIFLGSTRDIFRRAIGAEPHELIAGEGVRVRDIAERQPVAIRSQQAGRLHSIPPGYVGNWRYGPRLSGVGLPV